nr:disintegrin and metalloproteinase domain-containing protein 32-like [Columba livia]
MVKENLATQLFLHNSSLVWTGKVLLKSENTTENKQAVSSSSRYVEMHAVLDKLLYDYMGADKDAVTAKMVQLFSYLNSMFSHFRCTSTLCLLQMFSHFNVTIVLSSLEFWTEDNKIPTTGSAEEMLQEFLQWKNVHREVLPGAPGSGGSSGWERGPW